MTMKVDKLTLLAEELVKEYQPPPSEDGGLENACKADYLLKSKR